MKELRFASAGGWSTHTDRFLQKVNEHPGCEVTMVWDPDREEGKARAERFGCRNVDTYEEIIRATDIDGVLITSPLKKHYEMTKLALEHGKHVFVEKPAFLTVEEGRAISKLLDETGLWFLVSDPIRSSIRQIKLAKQMMDAGTIGKVTTVRTRCAMPTAVGAEHLNVFNASLTGGGIFSDIGCHVVHMLYLLMGKPVKVQAVMSGSSAAAREYGVEDNVVAVYEYENGVIGIAESSALAERREDYILVSGTEGTICSLDQEFRYRTAGGDWISIPPESWPEENLYPLNDWIDRIQNGGQLTGCGIENGIAFTEMIENAYRAAGRAQAFDNQPDM